MKLLLLLNEPVLKGHIDWHISLDEIVSDKLLESYQVYPFLARRNQGLRDDEVVKEILAHAKTYLPDIILWAHTTNLKIEDRALDEIKNIKSFPAVGYWDGDIWQKPILAPENIIRPASKADIIFCQGIGDFSRILKKKGAKDIRYVPATSDEIRFFQKRPKDQEIIYDVVMIGNNVTSRLPWRTAPGSRWRKKIAQKLFKELGSRFAIYGHGWKDSYGKGPVAFNDQVKLYHQSKIALGINNWIGPRYYFSNRLPIAMSSGVPVLYNCEDGFDEIFGEESGVSFFTTTNEILNICNSLLSKTQHELDSIGDKSYAYAKKYFNKSQIIRYMIESLQAHKLGVQSGKNDYDLPENPWINYKQI